MPVLRRARGPHAARGVRDCAARAAARHTGLARPRRSEPLPGVRAPGGDRPQPPPRSIARRAGRRRARRGCDCLVCPPGGRPDRRPVAVPLRQRGSGGRSEPAPQSLSARLAPGSAARRHSRAAEPGQGGMRTLRAARRRQPGDRVRLVGHAPVGVCAESPVRAAGRPPRPRRGPERDGPPSGSRPSSARGRPTPRPRGAVALNVWLHAGEHWHFEVVPRISELAGIELGADST